MKRDSVKRKILLLLLGGLALGLSRSPKQYFEILSEISNDIRGVKRSNVKRAIKVLYGQGMLKEEINFDGTSKIVLSDKGKKTAEFFSLNNLKIKKPKKWDGNWRIVIFDIPESLRKIRNALRLHLRNLDFLELQKSV